MALSNNAQKLSPPFILDADVVPFVDEFVVAIEVPSSSQVHKCNEKFFDRSRDGDFQLRSTEQIRQLYMRKSDAFSENKIYPYLTEDDFDSKLIARVRQRMVNLRPDHPWRELSDAEFFRAAGLWRKDFSEGTEGYTLAPDVVHLHNVHGYYLNIDVLFRWLAQSGLPVVWTLHDCWPFTGHCGYYTRAGCDRWLTGCFSCPQKRGYPASLVFDRSRKNWEQKRELFSSVKNLTLVPVSDWLAGEVRKSFLGDKKIVRIHNGTDTETFFLKTNGAAVREKYGLGNRFVLLGCASVWDARKGLADFLRLREHLPETDFSTVLVGLSNAQIAELPRGVVGIRRTESVEALAELYSAADLFFNPTYEDNFPTVNIESLACGTPVCTYRTGGSPEALDGSTGFVVEPGDVDGVLAAIAEIRSRGKAAYSAACRSRALACFRKEDRWAEYLRLYEAELRS